MKNKNVTRILLGTAFILTIPLVAMLFTDEVNWGPFDFVIAAALLLGTGLTYELVAGKMNKTMHRIIFGLVLLIAFLLVWAELAVGLFGTPFAGS
jgi:hypothetical protein